MELEVHNKDVALGKPFPQLKQLSLFARYDHGARALHIDGALDVDIPSIICQYETRTNICRIEAVASERMFSFSLDFGDTDSLVFSFLGGDEFVYGVDATFIGIGGKVTHGFVETESIAPDFVVSVIVSVHNVEKNLFGCLKSVEQSSLGMDKIQIILVDDGCTDGSEWICRYYETKYPLHVSYLARGNDGVASARGRGLGVARGKYVVFIGGDNRISPGYLEALVGFLRDNGDVPVTMGRIEHF